MSDYDLELFEEVLPVPGSASPAARRSSRLAARRGSDGSVLEAGLRAVGVLPAPGLGLSQLRALAVGVDCVSPVRDRSPGAPPSAAAEGRKRKKKLRRPEILDSDTGTSAGPAVAPLPVPVSDPLREAPLFYPSGPGVFPSVH